MPKFRWVVLDHNKRKTPVFQGVFRRIEMSIDDFLAESAGFEMVF